MDDRRIVALLFERSEEALEQITRKYAPLYQGIIRGILGNEADIEECANDVLWAVWNSIPPNDPGSLCAYLCRISRNVGIDRLRYNKSGKRNDGYSVTLEELGECLCEADGQEESDLQIKEVLSRFVKTLEPVTRVLFIRRYVYLESVAHLSLRFGIKENVISAKLYRARKKLKKLLEKEGIRV